MRRHAKPRVPITTVGTEPHPHLNNRSLHWPRGKVLGGSSSLNAMVYVRGHPLDYERWADEGAAGWGWEDVLPYFKKAESYTHHYGGPAGSPDHHGHSGPVRVSRAAVEHPLAQAFLQAGGQAGYPVADEMNGATCGARPPAHTLARVPVATPWHAELHVAAPSPASFHHTAPH
jgi:choline dehydrogenase-like flavoprotein